VCGSRAIFTAFSADWTQKKSFSLAVTCVPAKTEAKVNLGIGSRVLRKRNCKERGKNKVDERLMDRLTLEESEMTVAGVAVSWGAANGHFVSYYIPFLGADASPQAGKKRFL